MTKLFAIILLLGLSERAICNEVMGSHLEWQAGSSAGGQYRIRLRLYLDEASSMIGDQQQSFYLFRNDRHWEKDRQWQYFGTFNLQRTSSSQVSQKTIGCEGKGPRVIYLNIYETTIQLDADQFPSGDGYVLAWAPPNKRDGNDINLLNSGDFREWVTTVIPSLEMDGVKVRNSSPAIGDLNTFYLCRDELSTIKLPAVDNNSDKLRYKLSKPRGVDFILQPSGYQSIYEVYSVWAKEYDDQNQMHGNPALTLNEDTGEITVKPSEEGQYFIDISVEEYRDGKKIGTLNFYYTLTVVNCGKQQIWDEDIYKDTTSIQSLTICEGTDVTLSSKQSFPDPQPEFQWTKNGKTIWGANAQSITIQEEGNYQLLTKNIDGCPDSFDSEIVHVSITSASGAEMDSIPPICDITTPPIALNATPSGGTFTGPGVAGNAFDPHVAGLGKHEVEYVIQATEECPASVTKREVIVSEAPALDLENILYASRDIPISIGVKDSLDVAYKWMPPTYLNSDTYANPISTPAGNVTYTVSATNEYGCSANREVKVKITEHILIPDAFTPNKDGINETWELKGIESYPKCLVTIYNRWGEVIFNSVGYQNAFDGTLRGALQMPGVYAYKIRLTENSPELMGSVTLIR